MRTIAEGAETAAQLSRLQDLRCDFAQSFYIMEPADAAAVSGVLQGAAASLA